MALDWFILEPGADREPRRRRYPPWRIASETAAHFSMNEDAHFALMSRGSHLPLLRRSVDYYADALYTQAEVAELLAELVALAPLGDAEAQLKALCEEALRRQCGIVALAD